MSEESSTTYAEDEHSPGLEAEETPSRRSRASRLPALGVALIVVAAAGGLALVANNLSDRQERRLLEERTSEVSSVLSASISGSANTLNGAGAAAVADGQSELFNTLTLNSTLGGAEVVVARQQGGAFLTIARAGQGSTAIGQPISTEAADVAARAVATNGMVTGIVTNSSNRRLILALALKDSPGVVAYIDSPRGAPRAVPSDPDSPYRELNAALYSGSTQSSDNLVFVYGDIPGKGGQTVSHTFPIGADTWLIAVSAREPLVGSLAAAFPWLVLGTGIALALALALLVEVLIRRRAYALKLVEDRTRSLLEARMAAEKANTAKSDFLSRMSHELRTPLNAVLGFGQLLELDDLTEDQAENVSQITKGGAHLLDLINEILDISRIESGHMSLSPEAVLVGEVIEAALSLLRPLGEDRAVNLIGGGHEGCKVYVFADRQRLQQILLNLVGNGIKYNRQGGSVSISCFQPSRGTLRIQVSDTGPGIAADQHHLLFAPFERLGAEQTSVPGSGVGLALSRGLAEAMGGHLDLESTSGRGSTFWVEFPIVENPVQMYEVAVQRSTRTESVSETEGEGEGEVARTGTTTVLHIEDNLANAQLVERVLAQRPDITVVPAMQGRMGIDLARQHRPVLILLDLNLVDLPGDEVLQILREDPLTADIPVAIVSADAMPRQVQRLMSSGAVAYLTKPIDIHRLLEVVDDAVAQASARTPAVDVGAQSQDEGDR